MKEEKKCLSSHCRMFHSILGYSFTSVKMNSSLSHSLDTAGLTLIYVQQFSPKEAFSIAMVTFFSYRIIVRAKNSTRSISTRLLCCVGVGSKRLKTSIVRVSATRKFTVVHFTIEMITQRVNSSVKFIWHSHGTMEKLKVIKQQQENCAQEKSFQIVKLEKINFLD